MPDQPHPAPFDPTALPAQLRPYVQDAPAEDVSGHSAAQTYRVGRDGAFMLKTGAPGSLRGEAEMAAYFHKLGLGAEVLCHCADAQREYLLTARLPGLWACGGMYLEQPKRLCEVLAGCLRQLHSTPAADCPYRPLERWLVKACEGGQLCDARLLDGRTPEEELALLRTRKGMFTHSTLIHGDACLPNILLQDWRFTGWIDLGGAGLGDPHVDLYWALWSLEYNLRTAVYGDYFLDCYGRAKVDEERLRLCAAVGAFSDFSNN
jgi:kanamycin kinase